MEWKDTHMHLVARGICGSKSYNLHWPPAHGCSRVWHSQPFWGGGRGEERVCINDLCHSRIVVFQSDCSILVNYILSRLLFH